MVTCISWTGNQSTTITTLGSANGTYLIALPGILFFVVVRNDEHQTTVDGCPLAAEARTEGVFVVHRNVLWMVLVYTSTHARTPEQWPYPSVQVVPGSN